MPAPEASGYPGQIDLAPHLATIAVGGRSYLVYPSDRPATLADAPGEPVVCLVARNRAGLLRTTLRRLADPSLPQHRVVVVDGGSDDSSLSVAIAHAATHENATVLQSARDVTLGALYTDVLELVGSGTAILVPLHPELAAVALDGFASALERADDARAAIMGEYEHVVHGDEAAAALMRRAGSAAAPLMALRGPARPSPALARCTTPAGVALALCGMLQRGTCAVARLPSITGAPMGAVPSGDLAAALDAIELPWSTAIRSAAAALGAERSAPAASVTVEHPDWWVDEDTRALADALDRAGIVGDADIPPDAEGWTIRWLAPAAGEARVAHGPTALRLVFPGPALPESWLADARAADVLLVASESHAAACRAAGVPAENVAVVPPVVDTTRFRPGIAPLRLGQDDAFTFLLVTPWDRTAGWDRAVASYLRAFSARDDVSLAIVVVGREIPSEDEAGADVLAVIAAAGLEEDDVPDISLHTTPGALEHLPAIYAGSHCLIAPGPGGQAERSAIEAMASAVPVIAPLGPVLVDALDGSSGVPLPTPWTEADLVRALAEAASDRTSTAAKGGEARRRALAAWSGDRAAAAVIRALGPPSG
jgi:glycosyltransferase involved in cell wall biosynthesis